jgi:survival-of-motor-neuron-related-splicing factor 30
MHCKWLDTASGAGASAGASSTVIVTPPSLNLPSILPASVAEQIRRAQVKAAILGQADAAWAIGAKCQAVYSADGQFYNATVEAVTLVSGCGQSPGQWL